MWAGGLFVVGCVAGNLAANHRVSGLGGDVPIAATAELADGADWNAPGALVLLPGRDATVDLGEPQTIRALAVQADNDDSYVVEGSVDARSWRVLWTVPPARGMGLRTRYHTIEVATGDGSAPVRLLQIHGRGGDGSYSLGWIGVYCEVPPDFPSEPGRLSPVRFWRELDDAHVVALKGVLAAAGALLLLAGLLAERAGRGAVLRRTRDAMLAVLGLLAFTAWFNFGRFHFDEHVHQWDIYHYYLGAKYFPELGYTRLYECTTVAEAQSFGPAAVSGRTITNLVTNLIEPAAPAVADPGRCTSRFTPERWRAFVADVRFFRRQFSDARWRDVLHDHGYNGTPVWGLAGRALASLGPASPAQLELLALIDPVLLAILWGFAVWAFGWRVACVALLFWGTNYPARYYWNGGAFLRMDWLAAAVIGICLVKRGRSGLGGFAIGTSALLRVFPAFIVAGLVAKLVGGWLRERRLGVTADLKRFVVGLALAVGTLVPLALAVAPGSGLGSIGEFVDNSRKHLETPLTNNMGWKTVVAYDSHTRARVRAEPGMSDPWGPWKDARRATFASRRPIFVVGVVLFLGLLGWAAARQPDWVALVLGAGLIPFAAELTCYYYGFLLVYAFLWPRRPLIGVALLTVSAASTVLAGIGQWDDARYFNISVWVLVFVVAATLLAPPARRAV